jgi:tRNA(Ile)-lysidine synthase
MHVETGLRVGRKVLTLVRPMLAVRREEIDAYVREHQVKFREDASNAVDGTTRNRVRLSLLPVINAAAGRDVVPMVLRLAQVAAREDAFMAETSEELVEHEKLIDDAGRLCLKPALKVAHEAMRYRVLRLWLQRCGVGDLSSELIEQAARLITERMPARINLPGGRWLRRKAGVLWVQ